MVLNALSIYLIFLIIHFKEDFTTALKYGTPQSFNNSLDTASNFSCKTDLESCPSWAFCNSSSRSCQCYDLNYIFLCDEHVKTGGILNCHCLTFNAATKEEGNCLYNCNYYYRHYFELNQLYTTVPSNVWDLNEQMCGKFNRTGTLCGECIEGTYLRAYSYDMSCTSCNGGWLNVMKYVVVAFIPQIVLYIFILIFSINISSSKFQGFVFYCQVVASPMVARIINTDLATKKDLFTYKAYQYLGTFYGILNLDFFRLFDLNICFQRTPLTILSLDFLVAAHPLFLIVFTCVIILLHDRKFKPLVLMCRLPLYVTFKLFRNKWDIKTSTVDAFITFMLLSYTKILYVCVDLLFPVTVHDINRGHNKLAVFLDPSVPYFGHNHLPYAITALSIGLVFAIFPAVSFILYPFAWFQKCLHKLPHLWQIVIHVVVDSLHGCYKDGTGPSTRDCRWYSAMPFFFRLIVCGIFAGVTNSASLPFVVIVLVLTAILNIVIDPYKHNFRYITSHITTSNLFIAIFLVIIIGMDYALKFNSLQRIFDIILVIMVLLHIIYIFALIIKWIINKRFTFRYRRGLNK